MLRRTVTLAALTMFLLSMLMIAFVTQKVKAQSTMTREVVLFSLSKYVPPRMVEAPNKYLTGGTNIRIRFNASAPIDFFVQNSWEYNQSSSNGWQNVSSHWSDKTALMNRTFAIPTSDTWYFTFANYEYSGIDVYDITLYRLETYEIHIESDKEFYGKHGQSILTTSVDKDGAAVSGVDVRFQVSDPNGNVILNQSKQTNAYGQASVTFDLPGEDGIYSASAQTIVEGKTIEDLATFATDTTPPTTLDDYDGSWHTADFTVTLSATDNESGVSETYYQINGGPTQNVSTNGQPLITTEGANNAIEYWSIDDAGNQEDQHFTAEIRLDKTLPAGSVIINAGGPYTNSTTVTLITTATDTVSGVYQVRYGNSSSWNNETWESPSTEITCTLVPGDGAKTVCYQIRDYAGLVSITYSKSILLDTASPAIGTPSRVPLAHVQPGQRVTISVNVSDPLSGVENVRLRYATNRSTSWLDLLMTFNVTTGLYECAVDGQEGDTTVEYEITAYDNVGNGKTENNAGDYYVYTVIPEFPPSLILILFIIATTLTAKIYGKKTLQHKVS